MKVEMWGFDEEEAFNRVPYGKQCPKRPDGFPHRVGDFRTMSLLDGGLPGDVTTAICIHCGKVFPRRTFFVPVKQPSTLKQVRP